MGVMKRLAGFALCLAAAAALLSAFGATAYAEEKTLDAPTGLEWKGYMATWEPVDGAEKYCVDFFVNYGTADQEWQGQSVVKAGESLSVVPTLAGLNDGDTLCFKVYAKAEGFADSGQSKSGNITYEAGKQFTLAFDVNGGSGVVNEPSTVWPGYMLNLGDHGLEPPAGKEFKCWALEDGSELTSDAGYTLSAYYVYRDTMLKAIWKDSESGDPEGGNAGDGNDGGGEPGNPEGGNDQPTGPEGDDPSGEQSDADEPKKPEPNDGKSDEKAAIAQTGDDVPFAGLLATFAAAGVAVLALRRRIA